ncbi:hypothetical protein [Methylobacterium sp. Leaf125]|uniref:hypothetical protein n=1 Tax=Methylobacterium sp. Leaf125 TaxID=1736265 RepID=UPI000A76BCFE|nr:hypothetical protein [Methylobacterium sp. Leaf125]
MAKKFMRSLLVIGLLGGVAAACNPHPLPEDNTGLNTTQIVAKVRCELRDGIRNYLTSFLLDPEIVKAYPRYAELAYGLRNGSLKWSRLREYFKIYDIHPEAIKIIDRYNDAAIAAEFIFDMTEINNAEGGIDFLGPVGGGIFSAGLSASATLNRNNQRTINTIDSFEPLITFFDSQYCNYPDTVVDPNRSANDGNIVYPITGSLRLQEMIGSFLNLNQSGNLTGLTNAVGEGGGLPTTQEIMKFTTKLFGGGNFGLTGNASPRSVLISKVGATKFGNERTDVHSLRIIIKLPLEDKKRTRTIAEQRLIELNRPIPQGDNRKLIQYSATVDLSLAPEKEYLEAKIQVAKNLGILLPN